jgi:ParB family transcriptional regulator, chromosome partitioning protein
LINDTDRLEGNYQTIPVDSVRCRSDHIRKSFSSPAPLKMTVSDAGLLQPILVCRNSDGSYMVIDGARRLAVLRELGVQDLIVGRDIIVDVDETEADVRFKQIIVNVQREDLNSIELGQAFVTLKEEYGYQYNEIAEIIAKTPHYVASKVGLIRRLEPDVRQHYLEDIEKKKCIQNTFSNDAASYLVNINVLEDIARIPQELQTAAYEEIRTREMDKDSAIGYLRELKLRPATGSNGRESTALARGHTGEMLRRHIDKISRDVEKLADSIGKDSGADPGIAVEIEVLIKRLCLLCVKLRTEKGDGLEKLQADRKSYSAVLH